MTFLLSVTQGGVSGETLRQKLSNACVSGQFGTFAVSPANFDFTHISSKLTRLLPRGET